MKRTRILGSILATLLLMGFSSGPKGPRVLVKVVDTNGNAVARAIVTITDDDSGEVLVAGAEANRGGVLRVDLDEADHDSHGHYWRSARHDRKGRKGRGDHDDEVLNLIVEAESPDGSLYGQAEAQVREEGRGTEVIRVVVEQTATMPEYHLGDFDITYFSTGLPNYSLSIYNPDALLLATDRLRFLPSGETTGMLQAGAPPDPLAPPVTSVWFWSDNAAVGGLSVVAYSDGFNGIEVLNPDGTVRLLLLP